MSTWWGFSAPPWWSLHHPHLSVPYIFPVILNMQNISVSLRKVPGFKDSNSISVSFNFFAKRKVKRKEKRCNSRKVIALPNSLPPVGPRDQDESLSFVRWFLFLFRLEREAGEEDGNMFPIWWPLKGFVFCVCVCIFRHICRCVYKYIYTYYVYIYLSYRICQWFVGGWCVVLCASAL